MTQIKKLKQFIKQLHELEKLYNSVHHGLHEMRREHNIRKTQLLLKDASHSLFYFNFNGTIDALNEIIKESK